VTWQKSVTPPPGRQAVKGKISCFSHHPHHATCVVQLTPAFRGITVVFFTKKGHRITSDVTGRAGKARMHLAHLKSGKHKYYAHIRHSARTFSATTKLATVFVQ